MIVKMKKLRVIAMADEREKLIDGMLRLGCMQVSEPTDKLNDPAWAALLHREDSALTERRIQQTSVQAALDAIGRYGRTKEKALRLRPEVTEGEFMDDAAAKEAGAASGEINDALAFLAELQTDENRMLSLREVSGHRVLIKRGPGNRGPAECGTTHEATSGMSS